MNDVIVITRRELSLPPRLVGLEFHFRIAAAEWNCDPLILAAICDRESMGGAALNPRGPTGRGDGGHGHGLMQIDSRSWSSWLRTHDWQDALTNVRKGAEIFATELERFAGVADGVRAAIAAYNCGPTQVRRALELAKDVDTFTTGGNYSADVMRRAAAFAERQPKS